MVTGSVEKSLLVVVAAACGVNPMSSAMPSIYLT